jgi:glycosyltransferase involved in cell wall biosynthesis
MATVTVANCEAAKDSIIGDEAVAAVEVITNGVDVERFKNCELQQQQPRIVGIMANLRPVKNIGLLIEAAAILAERFPDVVYQIAGEGDCLAALQAQVASLGVSDRITFLGRLDGVEPFLASLDVAVLCSDAEGMSNAILEYMSAGRPIVATAVGGTPELIQHEKTGLLVPAGDAPALAAAIARLLADRGMAARLGAAARQTAIEQYSVAAEMRRYEDLYRRLAVPGRYRGQDAASLNHYAVS